MTAQEDPKEKMNSIKQNPEYYFGEATADNLEDATRQAMRQLIENIAADSIHTTEQRIGERTEYIYIPRGERTRAFAYVKKVLVASYFTSFVSSVTTPEQPVQPVITQQEVQQEVTTETTNQSTTPVVAQTATTQSEQTNTAEGMSSVLLMLSQCEQVTDAYRCLTDYQQAGSIAACGKVTSKAQLTEDVYLIIYDDERTIRAILSPSHNSTRTNIVTGDADDIKKYHGCGVVWFK